MNLPESDKASSLESAIGSPLHKFRAIRRIRHMLAPALRARDRLLCADTTPFCGQRFPVHVPADNKRPPFFILGHPRSGTTLLREVLSHHPQLFMPPENGAIRTMMEVFLNHRKANWKTVVQVCLDEFSKGYEAEYWLIDVEKVRQKLLALKSDRRSLAAIFDCLYREYGAVNQLEGQIWGDKSTPGSLLHIYKLTRIFPNSHFIHLVRDGRDCVASCVKAGFYDGSALRAAYAWSDNNRLCRQTGSHLSPTQFITVKYESFVESPESTVRRLCTFLDTAYDAKMLNTGRPGREVPRDIEKLGHHANVRKPINQSSVGKWKQQLTEPMAVRIEHIMASELHYLGYEPS